MGADARAYMAILSQAGLARRTVSCALWRRHCSDIHPE